MSSGRVANSESKILIREVSQVNGRYKAHECMEQHGHNINKYLGADYTSQMVPVKNHSSQTRYRLDYYNFQLVLFDRYNPHLYHVPKEFKKFFNIPVFLPRINVRKRVYIIPHLRERKIVMQW